MISKLIMLWITKWVGYYYNVADLGRPSSPLAWRQRWPIHSAYTVKRVEAAQYLQPFVKCSRFIRKDRYVDEWVFWFLLTSLLMWNAFWREIFCSETP